MPDKLIDKAVELLRSTQDTPYKIAKATGLSQTIIGKWKKGEGKPSRANARYILDTMERMKFFEALERRDQEVSRLITIIEKMQGITQGAESAAQKKRRSGILISLIPSPLERKKYDKIKPSKISSI